MEQKISNQAIRFVWSFLSDRTTILDMPGHSSLPPCFVNIGIPQGSPLSPILFLFFASPMLERLQNSTSLPGGCTVVQYVDDIHLLSVSESHERNCQILEHWHDEILAWARECGVRFSPHKYSVMHFSKPYSQRKEITCLPNIPGLNREKALEKSTMRVLGVILDPRLTWKDHVFHVSKNDSIVARCILTISDHRESEAIDELPCASGIRTDWGHATLRHETNLPH